LGRRHPSAPARRAVPGAATRAEWAVGVGAPGSGGGGGGGGRGGGINLHSAWENYAAAKSGRTPPPPPAFVATGRL